MELQRTFDRNTGGSYFNLTGMRFGRWTVIERNGRKGEQPAWRCRCDCGKVKERVLSNALMSGSSNSCGCLRIEMLRDASKKHGKSTTKTYVAWQQMKDRCTNQNRRSWGDYGGRGIKVCPQWMDDFEQFAKDVGEVPYGCVLDRENTNGNYEPGNVRWVDYFVSARNTRKTQWFDWKGDIRTLTDIACMEGVAYCSFRNKVRIMGMTVEMAVADCKARGLTYKEKAKGRRPDLATTLPPAVG